MITKGYGSTQAEMLRHFNQHGFEYEVEHKVSVDGSIVVRQWSAFWDEGEASSVLYGLVDDALSVKGFFYDSGVFVVEAKSHGQQFEYKLTPKELHFERKRRILYANT